MEARASGGAAVRHKEEKKEICHVVINQGKICYASCNKEAVEEYIESREESNFVEAAQELRKDIADLSEKDMRDIHYQADYDNGPYDIFTIEKNSLKEDEEIEINDEMYQCNEILELLKKSDQNEIVDNKIRY
ncbi:MAG: hypothetical protein J6I73_05205 [Treponema sp.]|nr:hypothetical protein [Treponema sp.]